ncbi:MAG: prolyl oligopeptidase family serine peptidase [Simkaniaceae bacterium]|nr:prolyl oligopeptidase family serine peptidase [Candidatus Sacchlamyda saccharinae]
MNILLLCISLAFRTLFGEVDFSSKNVEEARKEESIKIFKTCMRHAKLYELTDGQSYRDITNELLSSQNTSDITKNLIVQQQRRIIVFKYPSDGYEVKGYISFTPEHEHAPLLFFLRGGNRLLGLMSPANEFSFMKNYTVMGTTYRGGINEGQDEFGGSDVNDVENLIAHIPQLETELSIQLRPQAKYILGGSRGGMEMFLALQRSTYLQTYFDKAVSLSGPMDLRITIEKRTDMKNMFIQDFGLTPGENEDDWLNYRSPINHCASLRKDLPLLLIQGTEDNRTHLDHGKAMFAKLARLGNDVTYWEIDGAAHCLSNRSDRLEMILNWLEQVD